MQKPIDAILWRRANRATLDTLLGQSRGQYHITLQTHEYTQFFKGISKKAPTSLGGFDLEIPIEPFTGANPVPTEVVVIRFMGDSSTRKDWNIPSQRPETAYPLWRPERAFRSVKDAGDLEYLVIARDVESGFHARWIRTDDFAFLPDTVQKLLKTHDAGWALL